jgi:hemolysin III
MYYSVKWTDKHSCMLKLNDPRALHERPQSLGEEIANSVSHGLGLLLALAAFPILVTVALQRGNAMEIAGASVFATTMVLLYSTSMLFHAFPQSRTKRIFQVLDHSAIYSLIAGTYTPFTLGVLRGTWGWILFGLVWSMAVLGTLLKVLGGVRYNTVSTFVYLAMGWLVVIAADTVWTLVPKWGIFWLVAGTACHFIAVLWYAA